MVAGTGVEWLNRGGSTGRLFSRRGARSEPTLPTPGPFEEGKDASHVDEIESELH